MKGYVDSYDIAAKRPKVGTVWVWELDTIGQLIEVTRVLWNGEEWFVETRLKRDFNNRRALNDAGRFWEAVTPVGGSGIHMWEQHPPRPSEEATP